MVPLSCEGGEIIFIPCAQVQSGFWHKGEGVNKLSVPKEAMNNYHRAIKALASDAGEYSLIAGIWGTECPL